MDCKNTSSRPRRLRPARSKREGRDRPGLAAFTLVEMLVAVAIGLVAMTALMLMCGYSGRSFAAVSNYTDLDQRSQLALDQMTREIRQVKQLTAYTNSGNLKSLTFQDYDDGTLKYIWSKGAGTLTRTKGTQQKTLLTGCDSLQFSIFQRTPISGSFDCYDPASVTNTKLVQMDWVCSRKVLGAQINSESVRTAKIVIRKR
jgi:type II secretory pathway pseudopilin PulG